MDENSVTFKGTVNGLTILLKQDVAFEDIVSCMKFKISSAGKFFKGAKLKVSYKGRDLDDSERKKLRDLLVKESGAEIKSFEPESEDSTNNDMYSNEAANERNNQIKKYLFFKGIDEGITKFYRGTVRSGQLVRFDGNLVVLGDVNPGGQLEATGNVVVMGTLRGVVHAGCDGNKDAIVAALNLTPTQLRIGDMITRSPDDKPSTMNFMPEIAYVKEDAVYIERFLPQR